MPLSLLALGWSDVAVLAGLAALVAVAGLAALWPGPPTEGARR